MREMPPGTPGSPWGGLGSDSEAKRVKPVMTLGRGGGRPWVGGSGIFRASSISDLEYMFLSSFVFCVMVIWSLLLYCVCGIIIISSPL